MRRTWLSEPRPGTIFSFLDAKRQPFAIRYTNTHMDLGLNELLVEAKAVAINPINRSVLVRD